MWHTMSTEEVIQKLNSNTTKGLSTKEVSKRQKEFGKNELQEKKKENILMKFFSQFQDFMIIILLISALVSAIMAYIEHTNEYMDSIIIIAIVFFNALMGVIQENKAEKSLEALKELSSPTSKVKRDGKIISIPSQELVPGDIVLLEAGNLVPADCRLIHTNTLKVEESALTGETVPITKDASIRLKPNVPLGDTVNMVFSTTVITNGHAEAIVTDIGMQTKVGKIAKLILTNDSPETPLQKKLSDVGKKLGMVCLAICIAIFIIGILKNISIQEMFMTSIGLAVAAIPEGLPAIVTIMLSIGVTKMAKKNAIIRKLPAVETLGSSSVICSDKTGTLTQNKMTVVKVCNVKNEVNKQHSDFEYILRLGAMCNDTTVSKNKIEGDPTEVAIVQFAKQNHQEKAHLYEKYPRIHDIPFDSQRKMMTTIHKKDHRYFIITKGAPDVILNHCTKYYQNGGVSNITSTILKQITLQNESMAQNALRVIAVAYKEENSLPSQMNTQNIEHDLIFVGLIGMIDPPRPGVKEAVFTCKKAGIKTVMITGDHIITASRIASDLGILRQNDLAITGNDLDKLSPKEFEKNIEKYSVFARVSPEHKVKIVQAFQKKGYVVAMTGDGVNDAPALKNADIGVAMGKNGTDVAKNAADMVLMDDNFVTIVEAVKEGRHIYDNIKKAIHFLISTNVGEIVTIFIGLLLGLETPLLAIHLLWINLVTDSLPAIGLGLEPPEDYIMNKKPKSPKKGIFADGLWSKIILEGCMIGIITLIAFYIGITKFSLPVARTMAFLTLGLSELVHSLNVRSEDSIFSKKFFSNKFLLLSFLVGAFLQITVTTFEPLANIFETVTLNQTQWIYTLLLSLSPIFFIEIKKRLKEKIYGKTVYELRVHEKS